MLRPIRKSQDAEHNAAVCLRHLGFVDAETTPEGTDGGVDVRGCDIVAQVKAETAPVGLQVVQALFGCAAAERVTGAVFSLSGFTPKALGWAELANLALFDFDLMGAAAPLNAAALELNQNEEHLDEQTAKAALDDELVSRRAELEEHWGLLMGSFDSPCILGLVDRSDEAQVWAGALSRFVAWRIQSPVRVIDDNNLATHDVVRILMELAHGEVLGVSRFDLLAPKAREMLVEGHRGSTKIVVGRGPGRTTIPVQLMPFGLVVTAPRAWAQADSERTKILRGAKVLRLPYIRAFVRPKGSTCPRADHFGNGSPV